MKLFLFLLIESLILCELQASIVSIESHEDDADDTHMLTRRKLGTTTPITSNTKNNDQKKKEELSRNIFTKDEENMDSRNYVNSASNVFLHKEISIVNPSDDSDIQMERKKRKRGNHNKKKGRSPSRNKASRNSWTSSIAVKKINQREYERLHDDYTQGLKCGDTYTVPSMDKVTRAPSPTRARAPQITSWNGNVSVTGFKNEELDKPSKVGFAPAKAPSKQDDYYYVTKGTTYVYNPPSCNTHEPSPSPAFSPVKQPQVVYTPKEPTKANVPSSSPSISSKPTKPFVFFPIQAPSAHPTLSAVPSSQPLDKASSTPSISSKSSMPFGFFPIQAPSAYPTSSMLPSLHPSDKVSSTPSISSKPSMPFGFFPIQAPSAHPTSSMLPSLHPSNIPSFSISSVPSKSQMPTNSCATTPQCSLLHVDDDLPLEREDGAVIGNLSFIVCRIVDPAGIEEDKYHWEVRIDCFDTVLEKINETGNNRKLHRKLQDTILGNIQVHIGFVAPSNDPDDYELQLRDTLPFENDKDLVAEGFLICGEDFFFSVHLKGNNGESYWAKEGDEDNKSRFTSFVEESGGSSEYAMYTLCPLDNTNEPSTTPSVASWNVTEVPTTTAIPSTQPFAKSSEPSHSRKDNSPIPSEENSRTPSERPSLQRKEEESSGPTTLSSQPTGSLFPSLHQENMHSMSPSARDSFAPSKEPSLISAEDETSNPSNSKAPLPTSLPTAASVVPSVLGSDRPSLMPSNLPTKMRSDEPSLLSSNQPSTSPSVMRSDGPSSFPTDLPTKMRSDEPSLLPSNQPSSFPTDLPSIKHSSAPSEEASITPSIVRSDGPSIMPSNLPSFSPSEMRSDRPSLLPSNLPPKMRSDEPSLLPSNLPSSSPSLLRSDGPSSLPTNQPSKMRSDGPSLLPSNLPSSFPSSTPSVEASITPSIVRSDGPSYSPSSTTSVEESSLPSLLPSMDPSNLPTKMRSDEPSLLPSVSPSVKESSAPSLTSSSIPTLVSSNKPSVSSSPTTRYVCPAMSVEYNLCLQRGNYKNKYDEVGNVTFAVSTVNNEYVWELRIENFVDDIVGKNILRQDTLENIKAYVGSSAPSSNAGSYNYKFTDSLPYTNDADLIAFGGLSCDNDLYFGVHLDADTGDTIWAIPCSDGRSADVPYVQFTEGWGGYSSYSSIDCHECNDLLLENSIFRRDLYTVERLELESESESQEELLDGHRRLSNTFRQFEVFHCLFDDSDTECPYCLPCLSECDDECGFFSYPSEEEMVTCLENLPKECATTCKDVCHGKFVENLFEAPMNEMRRSLLEKDEDNTLPGSTCSAEDLNQKECPHCETCLAQCDDECIFYGSGSIEEWNTCFDNVSDECIGICWDVCKKDFAESYLI